MAKRKRRAHAKAATGTPRKTRRRRRANPAQLMLANPSRQMTMFGGGRTRKKRTGRARRKRSHTKWGGVQAHSRRTNPSRRRRTHRRGKGIARRHHRMRRHSNPMQARSIMSIIGIGAWGAGGIVVARITGNAYDQYVSSHVLGITSLGTQAGTVNSILRLIAQELGVYLVERGLSKMNVGSPVHRMAFFVGGSAEVGREALGLGIKQFSPTTDLSTYGLNGPSGGNPGAYLGTDGVVYVLDQANNRYLPADGLSGVEDAEEFGGVEDAEEFGGMGYGYAGGPLSIEDELSQSQQSDGT